MYFADPKYVPESGHDTTSVSAAWAVAVTAMVVMFALGFIGV